LKGTKIRAWVLTEPETKNNCASEGQQQFTELDGGQVPSRETKKKKVMSPQDSEPKITVLAKTNSNLPDPTRWSGLRPFKRLTAVSEW
jgi:hypothetical protein